MIFIIFFFFVFGQLRFYVLLLTEWLFKSMQFIFYNFT